MYASPLARSVYAGAIVAMALGAGAGFAAAVTADVDAAGVAPAAREGDGPSALMDPGGTRNAWFLGTASHPADAACNAATVRVLSPTLDARGGVELTSNLAEPFRPQPSGGPFSVGPVSWAAPERTWMTSAASAVERRAHGDVTVYLHVAAEAYIQAELSVRLGSAKCGEATKVWRESSHAFHLHAGLNRVETVSWSLAGHVLEPDAEMVLSVASTNVAVVDWLRFGSSEHPSRIDGLRLSPLDTDGDGIPDSVERTQGTDPDRRDSDGDGVSDGAEAIRGRDPQRAEPRAGQDAPFVDSDKDGLADSHERHLGTDSGSRDSDGDGYGDGVEHYAASDPRLPESTPIDTDHDGLPDVFEAKAGLDPMSPDSDADGTPDAYEDPDQDNLVNLDEAAYGTDPRNRDTDGDGFFDGHEVARGWDPLVPQSIDGTVAPAAMAYGFGFALATCVLCLFGLVRLRRRAD